MNDDPTQSLHISASADLLARLQKRWQQLDARIEAAEAGQRQGDRKARTRRTIVLSEAVLAAVAQGQLVSYSLADVQACVLAQPPRLQDRAV